MTIALRDFRTGEEIEELPPNLIANGSGAIRGEGVFQIVRFGLFRRRPVAVAMFPGESGIFIQIGEQQITLDDSCEVRRRAVAPFVKQFSVRCNGQVLFSDYYWYSDLLEDGGFDTRDFLLFISEVAGTPRSRARFAAGHTGENSDAESIAERVERAEKSLSVQARRRSRVKERRESFRRASSVAVSCGVIAALTATGAYGADWVMSSAIGAAMATAVFLASLPLSVR